MIRLFVFVCAFLSLVIAADLAAEEITYLEALKGSKKLTCSAEADKPAQLFATKGSVLKEINPNKKLKKIKLQIKKYKKILKLGIATSKIQKKYQKAKQLKKSIQACLKIVGPPLDLPGPPNQDDDGGTIGDGDSGESDNPGDNDTGVVQPGDDTQGSGDPGSGEQGGQTPPVEALKKPIIVALAPNPVVFDLGQSTNTLYFQVENLLPQSAQLPTSQLYAQVKGTSSPILLPYSLFYQDSSLSVYSTVLPAFNGEVDFFFVNLSDAGDGIQYAISDPQTVTLMINSTQVPTEPEPETGTILFTAVEPTPKGQGTMLSAFGNHLPQKSPLCALFLQYEDKTLRDLTKEAGIGNFGNDVYCVRDPVVHWSGTKALVSMSINKNPYQLYEVNLPLQGDSTPVVFKYVTGQPAGYNNLGPIYDSYDNYVFMTDRPARTDMPDVSHLYPALDEYEAVPTPTGLVKLLKGTNQFKYLTQSPSGDFFPILDSFGRICYTRWDHLIQDQANYANFGSITFDDESPGSNYVPSDYGNDLFPEKFGDHGLSIFQTWCNNQDGTENETLNHFGRHESATYIQFGQQSYENGAPNLASFSFNNQTGKIGYSTGVNNTKEQRYRNFFDIALDPNDPTVLYGIDAEEFGAQRAGRIVKITNADPGKNPEVMEIVGLTHPSTATLTSAPDPEDSGRSRTPCFINGSLVVSHSDFTNEDTTGNNHNFRLRVMNPPEFGQKYYTPGAFLTDGIVRNIKGQTKQLWEMECTEVKARTVPPYTTKLSTAFQLEAPEQQILQQAGVSLVQLQTFLNQNDLALLVSRDVTKRDDADKQQTRDLMIEGGFAQGISKPGTEPIAISLLRLFKSDYRRSYLNYFAAQNGRRGIATHLSQDVMNFNLHPDPDQPPSTVKLGPDGSMAAFVPANKAISYSLVDKNNTPFVHERYWITAQKGEIRVCASCHGINDKDQTGAGVPQNPPLALLDLLNQTF